jgi:hypothetical protein
MYKIEHVINAKATAVINGRETELFVGDELTQEQLDTIKVYGSKLIYRIDQNCTGEICGIDVEAILPEPSTVYQEPSTVYQEPVKAVEPPVTE